MILKFTADSAADGKTVLHVLRNRLELSSRLIKKLKYSQKILLNRFPVHVDQKVHIGDLVEAVLDEDPESGNIIPENIPIHVLFEDDSLIVLNKPPHIVVHPTAGHHGGTLSNALAFHLLSEGRTAVIRPVNRLDRDTSGVIVFAGNPYCQEFLIKQMKEGTYIKEYMGIVEGFPVPDNGTIDLPIARKPGSIMERQISPEGDTAITCYRTLEKYDRASLLQFRLLTGRTHQIRVHCQAMGHPLIGDTLYPSAITGLIGRQALHSSHAAFIHPQSKQMIEIRAPLSEDMQKLIAILKSV